MKSLNVLKLSRPALLATAGYGILLFAMALFPQVQQMYHESSYPESDWKSASGLMKFVFFLISLGTMAVSVYSIDCLTKGQCVAWSWFNAGIIFVWSVAIFIYMVFAPSPPVAEKAK